MACWQCNVAMHCGGLAYQKPAVAALKDNFSIAFVVPACALSQSSSVMPYISETVHPNMRASLITLPGFMIASGQLLAWILGYFIPWRMIAYLMVILPILLTLLIMPLPETPYWLIEKNKIEEARKSLQFFRGKHYDESEELNEIKQKHESKQKENTGQSWSFVVKRIFSMAFLKPFLCVGILHLNNTWGGFTQLQIFMLDILERSGSTINPKMGPIVIGVTRLIFAGYFSSNS